MNAMNNVLDNDNLRKKYSKLSLKRFEESKWGKAIYRFNDLFNEAIKSLPV